MAKKGLVLYYSKTGFTEKYAHLLSEFLNIETKPINALKKRDIANYDIIIFGAPIIAGKIKKISHLQRVFLKNKKNDAELIIFFDGASLPSDIDTIEKVAHKNIKPGYKWFYLLGGYSPNDEILRKLVLASYDKKAKKSGLSQEEKEYRDKVFSRTAQPDFDSEIELLKNYCKVRLNRK